MFESWIAATYLLTQDVSERPEKVVSSRDMEAARRTWGRLSRRKAAFPPADDPRREESKMRNVLSLMDLTLLGVGATLGTGVYILAGQIAAETAGPGVVLSFLIAAVASLLAALCYAELAAVVPTAGTAYSYTYVGVGEFTAFFVGWNLILEYAIATASVSRAFSNYVDVVTGNAIRTWSMRSVPLRGSFLAEYPGFLAVAFISLLAVLLALGVKESSLFNNVCSFLNLLTVLVTVVAGACTSNVANWSIEREDIPATVTEQHAGAGGFLPFGVPGVLSGAAKCFFAYVGFDTITACGEEARNPKRNIPLSILLTLAIIFVVYLAVSVVVTMMVPYYEQDLNAPFPSAFEKVGLPVISWIVTIGAMFAMITSMVGSMFPLPRVLFTMAADGMLVRSLALVSSRTGTSLRSTLLAWLMSSSMALLFNLEQLIDMMSIGTLTAYIMVAVSVVQIRYRGEARAGDMPRISLGSILKAVLNYERIREPSSVTSWVVTGAQLLFLIICIPATYFLVRLHEIQSDMKIAWAGGIVLSLLMVTLCVALQPCSPKMEHNTYTFRVPLVPFLPYLSIFINMSLMMMLDWRTWTRFGVWLLIGFIVYFLYSLRHSTLAEIQRLERKPGSQDNLSTLSEGLAISNQQQLLNDSAGTELNNKN